MYEVKLPELGEGSGNEATISVWHFEEGDHISEGDELVEMATDKATFGVPSPKSGILAEILADEGDLVSSGEAIAILEVE